ncbi:hypothetical protein VPH35_044479 [Triticum aestivum]
MVCGCGCWHHNTDGQRALVKMKPAACGAEPSWPPGVESVAALRRRAARGRPDLGERKASAAAWVGGELTGARAWLQASGTPGEAAVHDEQLATPYGRCCRHQGEERSVGGEKDRGRAVGRPSGRLSFMPNELLR